MLGLSVAQQRRLQEHGWQVVANSGFVFLVKPRRDTLMTSKAILMEGPSGYIFKCNIYAPCVEGGIDSLVEHESTHQTPRGAVNELQNVIYWWAEGYLSGQTDDKKVLAWYNRYKTHPTVDESAK